MKLGDQLAPIRQKIREKEVKKQLARTQTKDEESQLSKALSLFKTDVDLLKGVTKQIEQFSKSNKEKELQRLNSKVSKLKENVDAKEAELQAMLPDLDVLAKSVSDQERHKKTIEDNITQLTLQKSIERLREEVVVLEKEIEKIEGADTCADDYKRANSRKTEVMDTKARHEGRRGGIVDNIRSLKVSATRLNAHDTVLLSSAHFTYLLAQRLVHRRGSSRHKNTTISTNDIV